MIEPQLTMDELGDAFGDELTDALEAGRWLQAAIDETTRDLPAAATGFDAATEARGDFGDRVMAALAAEPAPAPAGFLLPIRRRGFLRGLWASFRQASVATRGAGRPIFQRVAAFAYVLVLAFAGLSLTGVATFGALGMLPSATESAPPPPPPSPTPAPPAQPTPPSTPPSLPPDATPSPSPSPSESAEETDGPDEPGDSDDDGGNSGPGGGGDDNSGPGSSSSGSGSSGSGSTGSSGSGSSGSGSGGSGSDDSGSGSDSA